MYLGKRLKALSDAEDVRRQVAHQTRPLGNTKWVADVTPGKAT
jgi:hypothetical protein